MNFIWSWRKILWHNKNEIDSHFHRWLVRELLKFMKMTNAIDSRYCQRWTEICCYCLAKCQNWFLSCWNLLWRPKFKKSILILIETKFRLQQCTLIVLNFTNFQPIILFSRNAFWSLRLKYILPGIFKSWSKTNLWPDQNSPARFICVSWFIFDVEQFIFKLFCCISVLSQIQDIF